jgi:hypothetical protein
MIHGSRSHSSEAREVSLKENQFKPPILVSDIILDLDLHQYSVPCLLEVKPAESHQILLTICRWDVPCVSNLDCDSMLA